ncbi:MAG TPA: hypothetical protein VH678_22110 [Xanthobacteraceae bacterium]|jgi:hypothetical protein
MTAPNNTTNNIIDLETEAERCDELPDNELDKVTGGRDTSGRVDLRSLSIQKQLDQSTAK